MKPVVSVTFLLCLLFVTVHFVSVTVAADVAQDKPMAGGGQEYGGELASGRCVRGCCNRNFIGKCKVCCPTAEAAKAAGIGMKGKLGGQV